MTTAIRTLPLHRLVTTCALGLCLFAAGSPTVWAQEEPEPRPLVFYSNTEQTRYVRFGAAMQIWARYTDLNPGSRLSDDGQVLGGIADVSIRRFRASMDVQFAERALAYVQIGLNNLNFRSSRGKPVELLDIYAEYTISDAIALGGGKSAWNGISRYASPSTMRMLTLDLPLVALPTINVTDDLLRHLGLWAKGRVSRLDYRATVFTPYTVSAGSGFDPVLEEGVAKFSDNGLESVPASAAYLKWQFFEPENNRTPFMPGTYLGQKKVLNIGAGFEFQADRTAHLEQGEPVYNDMFLWAVDIFADLPVNRHKKPAVTVYAAVFDYDFGPNTLRNIGANNPTGSVDPDQAAFNGSGNAYPLVGTGRTYYLQAGYLLPAMGKAGGLGQLQPYGDIQVSDFDGLDDHMIAWNAGINWLFRGHGSKLSLGLQNRPLFFDEGGRLVTRGRRSQVVLQYQFRL